MSSNLSEAALEPSGTRSLPDQSFGAAVREAVRGSRRDYTEGPIGRAILLLAIPMVLEMVMESVFAICDVFFVSRLGADAVATVGLTESLLTTIYAIAVGLSIGATAVVARRTGEHDREGAARAAVQAIVLGVIDAAIAMRVLWFANAINILLGPCFIFGLGPFPRLGVTGAAVATNIGRGAGVLFALSRLWRRESRVAIHRRHLALDPAVMLRMLRLSASGTLQMVISTASWMGLIRILSTFGSNALAGYTIGIRVIIFALLPSWGLANAAATMVGQALGARRPERAERAVWLAGFYNMCFLGVVGIVFVLLARPIVHVFTSDALVLPHAVNALRIVALGFVFYAYGMVLAAAFNGAGDTLTPTLLNFVTFWLWEIPLAYVLAETLHFGPRGVYAAITIAFSTFALLGAIMFRRGRWKERKV